MSAFMCSNAHISAMVRYAAVKDRFGAMTYSYKGVRLAVAGEQERVFLMLAKANADSVNDRYAHNEAAQVNDLDGVVYNAGQPVPKALTVIKLAHCFDYQACELDDYDDSEAKAFTQALVDHATRKLPGYDAEPWGLN